MRATFCVIFQLCYYGVHNSDHLKRWNRIDFSRKFILLGVDLFSVLRHYVDLINT